jgi:hypothetical protein
MAKITFFLFFIFVFQNSPLAETPKTEAKIIMDGVYDSFVKIAPYVYSDEKKMDSLIGNPTQKNSLIKNLTDISDFFKSARHVEYFQRPGFRPSLETINHHLDDTINAVKGNNYIFAQKRLKALTALCISCHSQLSEQGSENAFGNAIKKVKRENFDSDFAYANYLFLVRRFSESEKYYDLTIEKALKEKTEEDLYPSLRRLISINTKIEFNSTKANAFIDKYLAVPTLPILAKTTLANWSKELKAWKGFNSKKVKSPDAFIKKYLIPLEGKKGQATEGENDVTLLIASGVLSKHLNDFPKSKLAPEILYWLSIAERRLSNSYFFSLSDLYLKDCVKLYSKTKYARKCYEEYADNIEFGYSGSGGTDIPQEEKRELDRLKGYLK